MNTDNFEDDKLNSGYPAEGSTETADTAEMSEPALDSAMPEPPDAAGKAGNIITDASEPGYEEDSGHEDGSEYEDGEDGFDDIDRSLKNGKRSKAKKKKSGSPLPLIIVLIVCIIVLAVAVWQLVSIFLQYRTAENEYEDLLQYVTEDIDEDTDYSEDTDTQEDAEADDDADTEDETVQRVALSLLQEQNPDTVGWIEIPGTGISYPLMHTTDNAYYLTHTFSGKENSSGSIFVETLNSGDFTDVHTIIYGHNMKNGSMFAALKNYSSASYLVAHQVIYIDLEDGTHAYRIFSVYSTTSDSSTFTIGFAHDDEYASFLETIKANSEYDTGVTVSVEDDIITLSTCTNSGQDRYVVHAKKLY